MDEKLWNLKNHVKPDFGDGTAATRPGSDGGKDAGAVDRPGIAGGVEPDDLDGITGGVIADDLVGIVGGDVVPDLLGSVGVVLVSDMCCSGDCWLNNAASCDVLTEMGDAAGDDSTLFGTRSVGRCIMSNMAPWFTSRWLSVIKSGLGDFGVLIWSSSDITGETSSIEELLVDIDSSKSTGK